MSIPVHYAPAMDTDTDTVECLQSSHFVYNGLWYWQTGEWEVLTAGSTLRYAKYKWKMYIVLDDEAVL